MIMNRDLFISIDYTKKKKQKTFRSNRKQMQKLEAGVLNINCDVTEDVHT